MSTGKRNFIIGVSLLLAVILTIGCTPLLSKIKAGLSSKHTSPPSTEQEQSPQTTSTFNKPEEKEPVIVFFTSDLTKITSGEHTSLNWNVTGATKVTIDQELGTVNSQRGSKEISPTNDTEYTLTATNGAGSVTETVTVTVDEPGPVTSHLPPPPPPTYIPPTYTPPATPSSSSATSLPTISVFSANPVSVSAGSCSTLSWLVSGATSIVINPGSASVPASGSTPACPASTTTYTLTATNVVGSISRTVTVTVTAAPPPTPPPASAPVISSFTSSPASVSAGSCSTLSWLVSGATSIVINPGSASVPASGSTPACPASTTTYTLTATNAVGSISRTVTVTVTAAPPPTPPPASAPVISSFTSSPANVSAGSCSTLSWLVSGATSVVINPGSASVGASGSTPACPAATTTYTLTATNAAGSVNRTATVTVSAAPPPPGLPPVISNFSASPTSVSSGSCSTLSWAVSGATSVVINPGSASVGASGTTPACPAATTAYTLTATNAAGSVSSTATVTVGAAPPPPPADATTCEQALFNSVNALRVADGKAALTRNSYIDGLCRVHAQYMAAANTLSHDNFSSRANSIRANVPGTNPCAENVLQANVPCDAAYMAEMWHGSAGHWANIRNAAYTISGMGIVIDGGGKIWACQMFAGP